MYKTVFTLLFIIGCGSNNETTPEPTGNCQEDLATLEIGLFQGKLYSDNILQISINLQNGYLSSYLKSCEKRNIFT